MKYRDIVDGEYLLRSKDMDFMGRYDLFEISKANQVNKYILKSYFTGLTLEVYGNQDIINYNIFKKLEN